MRLTGRLTGVCSAVTESGGEVVAFDFRRVDAEGSCTRKTLKRCIVPAEASMPLCKVRVSIGSGKVAGTRRASVDV